jgi:hypothetical protein
MEYSSPLAAMRPQPIPAWGNRPDLPIPRSRFGNCSTFGPSSFDFRNMSMQQARPEKRDYFTLRPVRGSSPTSSLTADLDANFHIDQRYGRSAFLATTSPWSRTMLTIPAVRRLSHRGVHSSRPMSTSRPTRWVSRLVRTLLTGP